MSLPEHRTGRVQSGDVSVFYRLYGDAGDLPILTMHGANYFDSYDWAGIAAGLSQNRQVATMDMRGFGESDWSAAKDYSTDARIEDAAAIAADLGWPRIIPIVHSMSGRIGIVMAARRPELVEKLVVVDSSMSTVAGGPSAGGDLLSFESIEAAMAHFQGRAQPPRISTDAVRAEAALRMEDGRYILKRDPDFGNGVPISGDRQPQLNDADVWEELAKIQCPVLVVHGVRSDRYTPEVLERMAEHDHVTIVQVDSQHDVPAQAPGELIQAVKDFLD
jgi:pimeloyl-ACP methyl ester carboxylesterase